MKFYRTWIALAMTLLLFTIVAHVSGDRAKFNTSRNVALPSEAILDEHSLPLLSSNGKYGFISSVTAGAVMSFSTATGKILSSVVVGETAGVISMLETGNHRLIAVPSANDPGQDRPATVTIVDATKPKSLEIAALTIFPKEARFTPSIHALLTADGHFGIIASSFDNPTLYCFSTETGQIISQVALMGHPSEMIMQNSGAQSVIAVAGADANTLSLLSVDAAGNLTSLSNFSPDEARFSEANNPALSADGHTAYIAAATGDMLFAVDVASGRELSSLKLTPAPQRVTAARNMNHDDVIAVTHAGSGATSGGVFIATSRGGQLVSKSAFEPPQPIEFASTNNVVFSEDATVAFIAAKSGMLFAFSTQTGEVQSFQQLGGELMSIALNANARRIAAVRRTASRDEILIADFELVSANAEACADCEKGEPSLRTQDSILSTPNVPAGDAANQKLVDNVGAQLPNPAGASALNASASVGAVKARSLGNGVQVAVSMSAPLQYSDFTLSHPSRIVIDVMGVENIRTGKILRVRSPSILRVRTGHPAPGVMRVVLDAKESVPYNVKRDGNQLIITAGDASLVAEDRVTTP